MLLVTIITICKNSEKTIRKTFESVKMQDYGNIEYIVIDGGSTDNTLNIVSEYSDIITHLVVEPDEGISDAFNKGISLSTGSLVGFLNSDDQLSSPKAIEVVAGSYVDENTILCGSIKLIPAGCDDGRILHSRPSRLRYAMYVRHPATYMPLHLVKRVGYFDIKLKIAMDYDFMLRSLASGAKFKVIEEALVVMHGGGVSSDAIKASREELVVKNKNFGFSLYNLIYYVFLNGLIFLKKAR